MVTTLHLSELQNCHRRASARDVRGWLLCAASSAAAASFSLKNKGHMRGRAIRKCRRMPLSERAGLRLKVSGISRSPALSQQGSQDATWAKVRRLQVSWFSALAPFNPSLFSMSTHRGPIILAFCVQRALFVLRDCSKRPSSGCYIVMTSKLLREVWSLQQIWNNARSPRRPGVVLFRREFKLEHTFGPRAWR